MKNQYKIIITLAILVLVSCTKQDQPACQNYLVESIYWKAKADSVQAAWGQDEINRVNSIPVQRNWLEEYRQRSQDNYKLYLDCTR